MPLRHVFLARPVGCLSTSPHEFSVPSVLARADKGDNLLKLKGGMMHLSETLLLLHSGSKNQAVANHCRMQAVKT